MFKTLEVVSSPYRQNSGPPALSIGIIGLGYVGAPLAYALAEAYPVTGFDLDTARVAELIAGHDRTGELGNPHPLSLNLKLSCDVQDLRTCDVLIVTVPTPVGAGNVPDLGPIERACNMVAPLMKHNCIVVFESTVYPGVTLDVCVPLLEGGSGKKHMQGFFVGYSPERINPGDRVHTLRTTTKIVSGDTPKTLDTLDAIYSTVTSTYRAKSIQVAEAAKVIENTQRDVNIALMNELSQLLNRLGVDTQDVIDAASTKWNFLRFSPGLVGGHCISVDPYYLSHQAAAHGYVSTLILAARATNDSMPRFVVQELVRLMAANLSLYRAPVVTVLGVTFKEDVPDVRNSKVADIVSQLRGFGAIIQVLDPHADPHTVEHDLGLQLTLPENALKADAIVLAVPHRQFVQAGWSLVSDYGREGQPLVVMDLKTVLPREGAPPFVTLWRP